MTSPVFDDPKAQDFQRKPVRGRLFDTGGQVFNVQAFGATGDGVTDDTAAIQAAIDAGAVSPGGCVLVPPGNYIVTGNPFANQIGVHTTASLLVELYGSRFTTSKQIKLPQLTTVRGSGRTLVGIYAAGDFVASAAISTIVRTSNVVTVTTATAHGLEVNATAVLSGVTTASFDGGWTVASTPTPTSFTYAQTAANASDTTGTVFIPLVVLGDTDPFSHAVRLDDLRVDCGAIANSVGIYSNNLQELSGASRIIIIQCSKYGIWIELSGGGRPYNYRFEDLEIYPTANVGATGVFIRGQFGAHRGLDNITIGPQSDLAANALAVGFDLSGAPGLYSRLHIEGCTNGIVVGDSGLSAAYDTDSAGMTFTGITGHDTVTTLLRLKNYTNVHDIVIAGARKLAGTNLLVDEIASITLTDEAVAFYVIGAQSGTRFSTAPSVPWVVPATVTLSGGVATELVLLPATNVATIRTDTIDGSDSAMLKLTPTNSPASSRGATLRLAGNEETNTGLAEIASGNVAGSVANLVNGVTGTGISVSSTAVTIQLPMVVVTKTDGTRGAAGTAGRVIYNSGDGNLNIDNGANWILPDGSVT